MLGVILSDDEQVLVSSDLLIVELKSHGKDTKGKCDKVFMDADYTFESALYGQPIGSSSPLLNSCSGKMRGRHWILTMNRQLCSLALVPVEPAG